MRLAKGTPMNNYEVLGIPLNSTNEEIRTAYYEAARRFHPDTSASENAGDEFLEIQHAYDLLSNTKAREEYDQELAQSGYISPVSLNVKFSRTVLPYVEEPQLVYALFDIKCNIKPDQSENIPLFVCLIVDRSTSMQGERMDQVKANITHFLEKFKPQDLLSVVAFSDRAEVIISPTNNTTPDQVSSRVNLLKTGGGTEIFRGLEAGMSQLSLRRGSKYRKHIILITDGRTYGDEDACLELAKQAAEEKVTISAFGLGNEWNDEFLDKVAAITGGTTNFIASPKDLQHFLIKKLDTMGLYFTRAVKLDMNCGPDVQLRYAYRICPESGYLPTLNTMLLGNLPYSNNLRFLLEFYLPALPSGTNSIRIAEGYIIVEVTTRPQTTRLFVRLERMVSPNPSPEYPPREIIDAMSQLTLYRMQEKALREVESGEFEIASKRLQYLATHLISRGKRDLAHIVLVEAENIQKRQQYSVDGAKQIKYGTRSLMLASGME
jgi:Ca-activated chloride channel homolog